MQGDSLADWLVRIILKFTLTTGSRLVLTNLYGLKTLTSVLNLYSCGKLLHLIQLYYCVQLGWIYNCAQKRVNRIQLILAALLEKVINTVVNIKDKEDLASKWMCILCTDPSCQNRFILTVHWINCVKLFCLTNRKSGNQL